ncbi:hypothetical protein SLINC_6814 [Streptomyces lincolnensis]|uniref:Uncharacterized protein n=1 Tax=Streptomyces lincolnensis TaxID=1915 RepID=A0A1B1MKB6_STRLN|nr:hypothetical protein [Streptomyces lincolnensis]ANS69038.1 hypothetical protein SLINC_6814 [Streptomyces lincolnensis]AXG57957.1 hypothetical protein SLCG_6802 [Streptomyces lincolnensis]QMV10628.1 hypothetical protein GJU35_36485 [Streptomyces lincolnensis]
MAVDQLPDRVREFANHLNALLARLDQGGGWCGVFWQRDPDGMQACLDGAEIPPWDVVEALLQDLAAEYGQTVAATEAERARLLHAEALVAHDARPGGRDALGDRFDVMLREQRYAAERQAELGRLLASAATREEADALRLDLAWARDDHARATRRCAELSSRMADLDRRTTGAPTPEIPRTRTEGRAGPPFRIDSRYGPAAESFPATRDDSEQDGVFGARPDTEGFRGARSHSDESFGAGTQGRGAFEQRPDRTRWDADASHESSGPYGDTHAGGFPTMPQQRDTRPGLAPEYAPQALDRHHPAPRPAEQAPEAPAYGEFAPRSRDQLPPTSAGSTPQAPTPEVEYAPRSLDPQSPHSPPPAAQPPEAPAEPAKQRKRRRGGARFAGMVEEEVAPVVVPPTAAPELPELPVAPVVSGRRPRGARFAGAAQARRAAAGPVAEPLDAGAREETVRTVERLVRLRGEGRSGEAHALLAEIAHWPAARYPLLAVELQRAGLGADWATLLWEAGSLPADRLVAAADALTEAGRGTDGEQILRQGVARPAVEIGQAVLAMTGDGRHREAHALLDAYVRVRTPEEAARSAEPDPRTLVPLLVAAARGVSDERHWDLVHALRVAGHPA